MSRSITLLAHDLQSVGHSCQLSKPRHYPVSHKASAHVCATACHLVEGLHDRSQASRIVPVRIHAEHLHRHEDKDRHRCVHERPIPSISLQASMDPPRMIKPHAHTVRAKSRANTHCHSRLTATPNCPMFTAHRASLPYCVLLLLFSNLLQWLLCVMRDERRERE